MSEKKPASRTPAAADSSSDTEDTFLEKPLAVELPKQVNSPHLRKPVFLRNAKFVVEELDIVEEVLEWQSNVFPDGSSYEGTVWGNVAHGKGVYKAEQGRVRYEGEWFQNDHEGHGVLEVDIEPFPGSEGGGYRYSGQWKHGRMHGCGVFELHDRSTSVRYNKGRYYYGEYLEEDHGCDDVSELHSSIAEVAAAKARMFVNKPDAKVEVLKPLGNEELFERDERSFLERMLTSFQDKWKVMVENLEKHIDEKKKESELKLKMIGTDMEIAEAEFKMKEIIKEKDDELKRLEKEEEKKMEMELEDEDQVVEKVEESWKESKLQTTTSCPSSSQVLTGQCTRKSSVGYERTFNQGLTLRACHKVNKCITRSSLGNIFKKKTSAHVERIMCERKAQRFSWPCIHPNEELKYFILARLLLGVVLRITLGGHSFC